MKIKKVGAAENVATICIEMRFVAGKRKKSMLRKAVVLKLNKIYEVWGTYLLSSQGETLAFILFF